MTTTTGLLRAHALHKSFGRTEALRGASVDVAAGEVLALTGPSGSGKSTLLLCLAGVLRPEAGSVTYDGRRLDDLGEGERTRLRRREFGLVLQFGQLVPELSAVQNVMVPLLLERHDRAAARTAALAWLERLGAHGLADALPGDLSGGESQRVAMARALVTGPAVVFADEPTGALDTVSGEEVMEVLVSTARDTGAAIVLVTHDNRVAAYADREVVLRDGTLDPSAAVTP
ncbi:putative ABC transport system ATP-binding protein [Nocardioides scoriae]|uniref:Putative ABC transport system ATP-binding protein n=1 Tax=Nocardioides scoriae TaxID=642780 RepID=A0A1H1LDC4_9ACTN|nr:ABC transporter ATP-binding protein [Nocardioides scoriae]SDR72322.1 putative ABC transport system ATP-binding protein [Nocardioides scoriae]